MEMMNKSPRHSEKEKSISISKDSHLAKYIKTNRQGLAKEFINIEEKVYSYLKRWEST
jgi:hypothetical protein